MNNNEFNLTIDIYDFKEDESLHAINHVIEVTDGDELFGQFLESVAKKHSTYKFLYYRLLNGND